MKDNIRRIRIAHGLTQTELASRLGLAPNTVCQWESGDRKPPSDRIPDLARALGCGIEELYRTEEETA